MKRYNVIAVYDPAEKNLLMCRRAKEPYKGMLNFAGGKIEPSETSDAARFAGELYRFIVAQSFARRNKTGSFFLLCLKKMANRAKGGQSLLFLTIAFSLPPCYNYPIIRPLFPMLATRTV